MSVELHPQELGFKRPFNHEVTQVLRIVNNNAGPVAFKVKTTAPKQYCVRPNSGLVKPHESVEVQVLLQAMKEDPPLDARCRDKFLVQSVGIDSTDENNVATLWSSIEKTAKSSIQEQKIKVSFLPAGGDLSTSGRSNGLTADEQPPAYSSPTPVFGSPAPASDVKNSSLSSSTRSTTTANVNNAAESAQSGLASVASAVTNAIPTNQQELQAQLDAARAKINDLTTQLSDPQVRQRKVAEAQEKVQTIVQQSQETGVPLPYVAALCLLSFIIAWIFF